MFLGMMKFLVAIFTALFAFFRFRDSFQTKKEKQDLKIRYSELWLSLEGTLAYRLPSIVVGKLIQLESKSHQVIRLVNQSKWFATGKSSFPVFTVFMLLVIALLPKIFPNDPKLANFLSLGAIEIIFITSILKMFAGDDYDNEPIFNSKAFNGLVLYSSTIFASLFLTGFVLFLERKLDLPGNTKIVVYAVNCTLDIVTVFFTFCIFKMMLRRGESLFYYVLAVLIDLVVAGTLAFLSLYLVSQLTDISISSKEIMYTLVGLDSESRVWQINEWFWLVHSTFIPTLVFLFSVLFAVFCKLIVIPVSKLFGKAGVLERPDFMFAALFGVLATMFGVLVLLIEF